ncbi:MAG: hypothetical protein K1Y01_02300 [Vicinamibacteria bacterium]|nr:hypothetical protein [Vicinamibacteria bacterium]
MKPGPRLPCWLAAVALLSACATPRPPEGRTIVIVQAEGPLSLEPCENNEDFSGNVLGNVFEPLVAMNADLRLVPALAASWYTPDATTWVFRLREGARWHDGRAVVPAEVAASLERARRDPKSRRRPELSQVATIATGGDGEVVLKTKAPFGALASQIAQVPISRSPGPGARFPQGTGPYLIGEFTPGGDTLLVPAGDGSRLHRLLFRVVPDARERQRMLADGRADIIPYLAASEASAIEGSPTTRVLRRRGLLIAFLAMDYARRRSPYVVMKRNPFQDVRVRRALSAAIDREALLKEALGGNGDTLAQLVVPEAFGFASGVARPVPDLTAARRLMAEAGLKEGFEVTLDFEGVAVESSMERVVQVLARQFAQIGVRVIPRPHTTQELLARVESHDTSFYLLSWVGTSGDFGSTAEFLLRTPSEGRGTDNGNYSSPEADALIDEASSTLDPGARLAILRRLEERVRADVPVIPLLRREDLYGAARGLSFELRLDREIRGVTVVVEGKR